MYIWIGCKLPDVFSQALREKCLACNRDIGLDTTPFSLPQHISLKISFDGGGRTRDILAWLEQYLANQDQFYVNLLSPEAVPEILWLPVARNEHLERLHMELDRQLLERFGIAQHPYDKDFMFHSTLFMGEDALLGQMLARLSGLGSTEPLLIDTFLLGLSPNGKPDAYTEVKEIKV